MYCYVEAVFIYAHFKRAHKPIYLIIALFIHLFID